jgi:hypothetical protein
MTIDDGSWQCQQIFLPTGLALADDLYSTMPKLCVENGHNTLRPYGLFWGIAICYGWH